MELDIRKLTEVITNSELIKSNNRGLINFATGSNLEPEIAHDILNARTMEQQERDTKQKQVSKYLL